MAGGILALILGLLLAGAVAEFACRRVLPVKSVRYHHDSEIGSTLAPNARMRWVEPGVFDNWVLTNSQGFHDIEHAQAKPPGVFRVVVLGDSFMEAVQLPLEQNFSRQLEARLREAGWPGDNRTVEVVNLGLSGRGPPQHYSILQHRGLALDPDLVIMAVLPVNDFQDSSPELSGSTAFKVFYSLDGQGRPTRLPAAAPSWWSPRRLLQYSSAAHYFVYLWYNRQTLLPWLRPAPQVAPPPASGPVPAAPAKPPVPEAMRIYLAEPPPAWVEAYRLGLGMIAAARDLAREHGAEFLAFVIPNQTVVEGGVQQDNNTYDQPVDYTLPPRRVMEHCAATGLRCLDLTPAFEARRGGEAFYLPRDGHFSAAGHALAAAEVADSLKRDGPP